MRTARELTVDKLIDELRELVRGGQAASEAALAIIESKAMEQIPITKIIREDLLNRRFTIPRALFPFVNRSLNAHGYRTLVVISDDDEDEVNFVVDENNHANV